MYVLCSRACGPQAVKHIYQAKPSTHVCTGYQPDKCYILAVTWGIWALLYMHALCSRACGPQAVRHIYQAKPSTHAHVTTITYGIMYKDLALY